jgi:hypothetical protein
VASLEVLEVEAPEATPVALPERYRATLELANSLQADRRARERVRLEREKLRLQQREAPSQVPDSALGWSSGSYLPPVRPYAYRPYPRRPHYDERHGHSPPHGRLRRDEGPAPDVSIRAFPGRR